MSELGDTPGERGRVEEQLERPRDVAARFDEPADQAPSLRGEVGVSRDQVDARIVREVRSRTGAIGRPNRVLPPIAGGAAYKDADGDGMSDRWEAANRCDPRHEDAWQDANGNGWANLDEFLLYAHNERLMGRQPL